MQPSTTKPLRLTEMHMVVVWTWKHTRRSVNKTLTARCYLDLPLTQLYFFQLWDVTEIIFFFGFVMGTPTLNIKMPISLLKNVLFPYVCVDFQPHRLNGGNWTLPVWKGFFSCFTKMFNNDWGNYAIRLTIFVFNLFIPSKQTAESASWPGVSLPTGDGITVQMLHMFFLIIQVTTQNDAIWLHF